MPKSVEKKKQRHPRFTDSELGMVKDIFAENEQIIRLCYKVFYQIPLTEMEERVKEATFKSDSELRNLFDKLFCPGVENEQIFYGVDDWIDVQLDKGFSESMGFILARKLSVDYILQQVKILFNEELDPEKPIILFKEFTRDIRNKSQNDVVEGMLARKEIIAKVRNMFGTLQSWAGTKEETKEQMMKRLFEDSTK